MVYIQYKKDENIKILPNDRVLKFKSSMFDDDNPKIIWENRQSTIENYKVAVFISDEIYIDVAMIRVIIDGSYRETPECIYIYEKNFERFDIPATMEECYKILDNLLDEKDKKNIRESSIDDLAKYHFGLGLWIRNNWIYPTSGKRYCRIWKVFERAGIHELDTYSPDVISSEIICGYHHYLNGKSYTIFSYHLYIVDDLKRKMNT